MDRHSGELTLAAGTAPQDAQQPQPSDTPDLEHEMLRIALRDQHAILENAPVGIVFTLPGQFKSCNPRICEMLDYSYSELSRLRPADIFSSPED